MEINDVLISFLIKTFIIGVCILLLKLSSILLQKKLTSERMYILWNTVVIFSLLPIKLIFSNIMLQASNFTLSTKVFNTLNIPSKGLAEVVYESGTRNNTIAGILFYIWLSGVIVCLIYIFTRYALLKKNLQRWMVPVPCSKMLKIVEEEKAKLKIKKKVNVFECAIIQTPMSYGIIKPIILLPPNSESISPLIIRHEMIHYKRKDSIIKLLTQITIAIYWFNPLIYMLRNTLNTYCELSCDERVLENEEFLIRGKYFNILLETFLASTSKYSSLVSGFSSETRIKLRLKGILNGRQKSNKRIASVLLITFLMASSLLIGCNVNSVNNTNDHVKKSNNISKSHSTGNDNTIDDKFDPHNSNTYNEPIHITYDSFEDIRPIMEGDKEVTINKDIDGYVFEGTAKIQSAVLNRETKKWEATFWGTLYKKE